MSQALRKLAGSLSKSNTLCIFINQPQKIGVMFGSPETTSGGSLSSLHCPYGYLSS